MVALHDNAGRHDIRLIDSADEPQPAPATTWEIDYLKLELEERLLRMQLLEQRFAWLSSLRDALDGSAADELVSSSKGEIRAEASLAQLELNTARNHVEHLRNRIAALQAE